ncbi:MAG: hypothetical protein DHS80DRAFT_24436 [Piptocephalis tieghemiana]|nr:MAG: hypothetical protein DHS80DRAFT_24436 [Piptocephalis tieghemiana]
MHFLSFSTLLVSVLLPWRVTSSSEGTVRMTFPDKASYVIPMQTAFEFGTPKFARQGMLDSMTFTTTELCSPQLYTNPNETYFPNASSTFSELIVTVNWYSAVEAGCQTFGDVAHAAQKYAPSLAVVDGPTRFRTLIISYLWTADTDFANPFYIPAYQGGIHGGDGPASGVDIVLVNADDFTSITKAVDTHGNIGMTSVMSGPGPWNVISENIYYRCFCFAMAIIVSLFLLFPCLSSLMRLQCSSSLLSPPPQQCTILSLRSIYALVRVLMVNRLVLDLRNIIFILALSSVACVIPLFLLRQQSYTARVLNALSNALGCLALELLVYLWTDFLTRVHSKSWLTYFKHAIWPVMLISKTTLIANLVYYSVSPLDRPRSWALYRLMNVMFIVSTVSMLILGGVYIVCAFQFFRRRDSVRISPDTVRALTRLAILALFAFGTFLILSLCNVASYTGLLRSPSEVSAYTIVVNLALALRGLCMLQILGIRLPSGGTTVSSSGYTFSGQGKGIVAGKGIGGGFSSGKAGRV